MWAVVGGRPSFSEITEKQPFQKHKPESFVMNRRLIVEGIPIEAKNYRQPWCDGNFVMMNEEIHKF